MYLIRLAATGLLLASVAACAGGPVRGPVSGRVTINDKPVAAATVFFESAEAGVGMNAALDSDGRYEVKSHQGVGLPVGTYKVAILPGGIMTADELGPKATEAKAARPKPSTIIPEKYHKTATSGITVEVKAQNEPFDFKLVP